MKLQLSLYSKHQCRVPGTAIDCMIVVDLFAHFVGLEKKHKLESRLLGEISITSDMQMTPPLWQKVKRNYKASCKSERGE